MFDIFNRFLGKLEAPSFTIINNVVVSTRFSINKKAEVQQST